MTYQQFKSSIASASPPDGLSQDLLALWHDANEDWHKAHDIVQKTSGYDGDWIHAYLHRKEGDLSNASYWYSRIGHSLPNKTLEEEWEELAKHLLNS